MDSDTSAGTVEKSQSLPAPESKKKGQSNSRERLLQRIAQGEHPLQQPYTFWFNRRIQGARSAENYEKNIKKVGTFQTVEEFWSYYNHMVRPNELPNTCDYHLFKKGVKPMWEDEANRAGGKWIIRLKKGMASRYWEDLVLAVIGAQFDVGNEICGVVISIRYNEDILSVWTRTSQDREAKLKIHDTLRHALQLPTNTIMEYKNHDQSMKDNSSFRNTEFHAPGHAPAPATPSPVPSPAPVPAQTSTVPV